MSGSVQCPKCSSTSLKSSCSGMYLCNDCQFMWTPGDEENGTYANGGGKSCGGCCGGGCCGKSSEGESRDNSSENESSSTPKCQSCGKDNPPVSWPPDKRAAYTPDKCYDCSSKKCKGNGACSGYNKCKKKGRDCQGKCAKAKAAAGGGCFSVLSDIHIKLIEPALKACCGHCGVGYSPPE